MMGKHLSAVLLQPNLGEFSVFGTVLTNAAIQCFSVDDNKQNQFRWTTTSNLHYAQQQNNNNSYKKLPHKHNLFTLQNTDSKWKNDSLKPGDAQSEQTCR